jgi:uncharacterized Ntn-hydrolase superfamily protein
MTFTIVARCLQTRQLGVCLATSSLGVASRCPAVRRGVAAISSQCHTNWRLGLIGLDLAERGLTPDQIIDAMRATDPYFDDYRQIGIVTAAGAVAAHSPGHGKDFTGHLLGDGFVAMGNALAGPQVVAAIHSSFTGSVGLPLPERLVQAIEAGYAAGGETIGQTSAGLLVASPDYDRPLVDLRIDMANPLPGEGGDAVRDLRRVFDAYKPLIPYYAAYWADHPDVNAAAYLGHATEPA